MSQTENLSKLGLSTGSSLVASLRHKVVMLASNSGVILMIQQSAQSVLQTGWSILLPTPEERAKTLSTLLPSSGTPNFHG